MIGFDNYILSVCNTTKRFALCCLSAGILSNKHVIGGCCFNHSSARLIIGLKCFFGCCSADSQTEDYPAKKTSRLETSHQQFSVSHLAAFSHDTIWRLVVLWSPIHFNVLRSTKKSKMENGITVTFNAPLSYETWSMGRCLYRCHPCRKEYCHSFAFWTHVKVIPFNSTSVENRAKMLLVVNCSMRIVKDLFQMNFARFSSSFAVSNGPLVLSLLSSVPLL